MKAKMLDISADWVIPIWRPEALFPPLDRSGVVKISESSWQSVPLGFPTSDLRSEGGADRLARTTILRLLELDPEGPDFTRISLPYFESGSQFNVRG